VETGPDYIERSNQHSHGQDYSKGLKEQQIVAVQEAVRTAPGVSASQLRRNMLLHNSLTKTIVPQNSHSFYCIVQNEHKLIREAQLHVQRAVVADRFGELTVLAEQNRWSELVRKHNDKDDPIT
jgi:hypothetical protein